jgi:hypothetical protein
MVKVCGGNEICSALNACEKRRTARKLRHFEKVIVIDLMCVIAKV